MITECPICGTWEGRFDGDGAPIITAWCRECRERVSCEECKGEVMDERLPPGAAIEPPFDPSYESETETEFDAEGDE